ncbi:MAG TPA: nuclease-related domain-containing protein [Chthoniobacterales bacterium]|nr:nuclease-related domain-containing protein [Chthoniobacterales bacterium]
MGLDWQRVIVVYGMLALSMACAALWIGGIKLRRKFRKERHPISEKIRRSPGYSLRLEVDQLQETYLEWVGILCFAPMFLTACVFATSKTLISSWLLAILIACIVGTCLWRLTFWHRKLRAHRLGLAGELIVAQYLDELREHGYKIFHDYPLERSNVDHVVVGPTGVFAIETKTRRKRSGANGTEDYKVCFDGQKLVYPHCVDRRGSEQAKRQAEMISSLLHRRLGYKVHVAPVLALPGWYVTEKVKSNLQVLNPKLLAGRILAAKRLLSADEIRNISNAIDENCRGVEI